VEWNESFESGLADIDVQHRYLFALIERIQVREDEIWLPQNRPLIDELSNFAMYHFACEERLMVAYGYRTVSKHVDQHGKLLAELRKYQDTDVVRPRELSLFLCNWIVAHTLLEDRALAAHVIQKRAEVLGVSVEQYIAGGITEFRPSRITMASPATTATEDAANE
jgi:hemerythrin